MPEQEKRVAGFTIGDGTNTFANITSYELNTEVAEEEVSGLNDTVGSPPILSEKYLAVSVGRTASMSGVSFTGDGTSGTGPSSAAIQAFLANAETGAVITAEYRYTDGSGYDLEGFFTSFNFTGDKGEATEKFSGTFRVNSKTEVTT